MVPHQSSRESSSSLLGDTQQTFTQLISHSSFSVWLISDLLLPRPVMSDAFILKRAAVTSVCPLPS